MSVLKKYYVLILCMLPLFIYGCKTRELNNPFDPDCQKEIFTPTDFKAEQEGNKIKLTWIQPNTHISGYIINRNENDDTMEEVVRVEKTDSVWYDINIEGGKKYGYQLFAYAGENISNLQVVYLTPLLSPAVTTLDPSNITINSALLGGKVTSEGGRPVTERGICYNTEQNPTIDNHKVIIGSGEGEFQSAIDNLLPNTTYYVRAYAINSCGLSYGEDINFKTEWGQRGTFTDPRNGGYEYTWVRIVDQIWMAENLAYLPSVISTHDYPADGFEVPYYYVSCYYGTDVTEAKATSIYQTYGVLYNWPAAMKACPDGWHLPSDEEWKQLEIYLGMSKTEANKDGWRGTNEGGKLKEAGTSHWLSPNNGATNESGFTALPGSTSLAQGIGHEGYWWSSTWIVSSIEAWLRGVEYMETGIDRIISFKREGYSVRCLWNKYEGNLIAYYPLSINGKDSTGKNSGMILKNAPFQRGGIYCNGVNGDCVALTPPIRNFYFDKFAISVDFLVEEKRTMPVIVCGALCRWLGFYLNSDGTVKLLYNNQNYLSASKKYNLNQWHNAQLKFDGTSIKMLLDNDLACTLNIQLNYSECGSYDTEFGTTNYSNGEVLKGYIKNLMVYNLY